MSITRVAHKLKIQGHSALSTETKELALLGKPASKLGHQNVL